MTNTKPIIPVQNISEIVNKLSAQHLGSVVVNSDLSNIADAGKAYEQLDSQSKQIVNSNMITLVTDQLFLTKEYKGLGPDLVRSRSAYDPSGGIIQVNRPALPEAKDDSAVYDPTPNSTSDPFKNNAIDFETTYYSKPFAFRYESTHPERWFTGMLMSPDSMNSIIRTIDTSVSNAFALNVEGISMSLIRASMVANLKGVTLADGGPRAINLLKEFNTARGTSLTVAKAVIDPEFMRWAINRIVTVYDDMQSYSKLFNDKEYPNFSTRESTSMVMVGAFKNSIEQFLMSDTYHDQYLKLPTFDSVTAWKSMLSDTLKTPNFTSKTTIDDTVQLPGEASPTTVKTSGVIATIFDNDRVGIHNLGQKVTTMYDPVGLKTNIFTHIAGRTLLDTYANGVTFYIA